MAWWSDSKKKGNASEGAGDSASSPAGGAAPPERLQEITRALEAHMLTVSRQHGNPLQAIDPNLDLYEAGYLDSLSASEFLSLSEKQFGIPLPDWLLGGQINSLAALAAYIGGKLAEGQPGASPKS